ncbi:hypothetical protein [Alteraurantiacibacter aquimixticola]|uniref:Uncharacterized protein n=1 Tax=Alteraurantiacibacter aquimixticola TaxID=2489173 RepID=A0A4T3EY67_9SPHN|nr:hypothetical protein [Alteraurantiacibacter aquimixticola]TIX49546.1 hypothetical protein E5222_11925 [Alteraurantiacibacter aquimixticola]
MDHSYRITRRAFAAGAMTFGIFGASAARAQFGLGDLLDDGLGLVGDLGVGKWLEGEAPVTTALSDAEWANPALDNVDPPFTAQPLASLERTDDGGFILQPGWWQITAQSYCLHAGTHGPGGGDGYLYAPLKGSADEYVRDILRNSVSRPDIEQRQIQLLIWAILARAKFEDLRRELQVVASQLLSRRQLARLNRSAMDLVPNGMMGEVLGEVPGPLRTAFEAEAALRRGLTVGGASYDELEAIAVLGGDVPLGAGSREIPSGRWSDHPDGYRIRYFPSGYSETRTDIWVAEDSDAVGEEYDPSIQVAVPGNTSRQRLAQSGRER